MANVFSTDKKWNRQTGSGRLMTTSNNAGESTVYSLAYVT